MSVTIAPLTAADRADWEPLYLGYCRFYAVPDTEEKAETVWGWLMDPSNPVEGLGARNGEGALVGITHFRPYHRPVAAQVGCFLDDLFVAPGARGGGVAAALIAGVTAAAKARGWSVVRWITAADNATARALYDRVATETAWVTYEIRP
ncbi:GNAT family N-acetyltransferase [Oharaeibacter diazotrophicus]|uniref:Acetyltransferase (GNAT) family protein n=1 Tax=Oharaeibacter diazotrophicus TaxID=1920512 RepID=A0A4R6RKD9_9HYPH|nr:GNAT family N-acetyltransferase [Oharaeibacter diazotrophicus]TDP86934.1 acetyltransferase (GNAT) family protein [Oharaeibacter diazotrophicus]BBE71123.1 acetyltransferase GNAT family protein [Pleomorphomonas sp. SM30]GLS77877.1 N-acetyltransferase [Oharaeibacter diazotrophicus]